jgi:hypothetical protein
MSDLLPCPFCGSTDLATHGDNAIFCTKVGCEAGIDMGHTVGPEARQDVARRWNTRVAADRIEALEAALREIANWPPSTEYARNLARAALAPEQDK